ncbi:SWIM zinc finger family protein [Corynebacterium phoceense]|uniref:SWIM zinc finger family protein n=1 Tax=Corynebacterium phoceense TaxID=1686286 RepID=UPI00211BB095|nr:SWIM zinc finger family protein [Corynebacterium phoceense]MCQ9333196.1 SWIM zinc finger family protein [Corynebacterium phoceense]
MADSTTGDPTNDGSTPDNVTYVNFGTRKRVTTQDEVLKVDRVNHSGSSMSPAATRLVSFMSKEVDAGRLARGRDYAHAGNVVGLDVRNGAIHGRVAGSQNEPFAVLIQLPYRSNDDVGQVSEIMARTPNAIRDARDGLLPVRVLDILLGEDPDDVRFSCSCPDHAPFCKHIVAVVDRLAARMDADPSVVFAMRGLSFATLEQSMVAQAQEASRDAYSPNSSLDSAERNQLFWNGRGLPDIPEPKIAPALEDSDMDLLRKALRSVTHTNLELLRAVSDIEELYDFLVQR